MIDGFQFDMLTLTAPSPSVVGSADLYADFGSTLAIIEAKHSLSHLPISRIDESWLSHFDAVDSLGVSSWYATALKHLAQLRYDDEVLGRTFADPLVGSFVTLEPYAAGTYHAHLDLGSSLADILADVFVERAVDSWKLVIGRRRRVLAINALLRLLRRLVNRGIVFFCNVAVENRIWFLLHGSHPPKDSVQLTFYLFGCAIPAI